MHNEKILISVFQEFSASINSFHFGGGLGPGLSFYGV